MKPLVLIRHGETAMAGLFCGHSDPPLTDAGYRQIDRAAALLPERPDVIYTSDLKRARQSADVLASRFCIPVLTRPGLREISFGNWEGLTWQEIEEQYPAESQLWMERYPYGAIPSGEPYEEFRQRAFEEMEFLSAESKARSVAVLTHAGFMTTVLSELYAYPRAEAHGYSAQYGAVVPIPPPGTKRANLITTFNEFR